MYFKTSFTNHFVVSPITVASVHPFVGKERSASLEVKIVLDSYPTCGKQLEDLPCQ